MYRFSSAHWQIWRDKMINDHSLLNILMVLFSVRIVNAYPESFYHDKKSPDNKKYPAWILYILFQYWVMASGAVYPLVVLGGNIISVSLIYKTSYLITRRGALFLSGILYALWMLTEVIVSNLLCLTAIEDSSYFFTVGSVVSKLAVYVIIQALKRFRKSASFSDIPLHHWVRLSFIPLATFYIIHNTYFLTLHNDNTAFFTITTLLMILINYITFDVYDRLGSYMEMEQRNLTYQQQLNLCNKQAAERESAYQDTRRIRHDINSYLLDLKAALQAGNVEDAKAKIEHLLEQNRIYRNEISTSGNLVIDSLINYKYSLARKEGIRMECQILVPEQLPFDSADLCIILGNLIDNAIDALQPLPGEQRYIRISVSQTKGTLLITVQNPYIGTIKKNTFGEIITGKPDAASHGIGLTSVRLSADKYGGQLQIDDDNNLFKVSVLLYPPENLQDGS